jgi:hypothetical protein
VRNLNDVCGLIDVQADVAHWVSKSDKREARLGYQHVSKESRMDEGMEDRLKQMEESFQKEAAKISKERANLKLQQQDLVRDLIHYILLTEAVWFIARRFSVTFVLFFWRNLWCPYC